MKHKIDALNTPRPAGAAVVLVQSGVGCVVAVLSVVCWTDRRGEGVYKISYSSNTYIALRTVRMFVQLISVERN